MGVETDLGSTDGYEYSINDGPWQPYNPALILGGLETGVTSMEMAHAYNTLAADGQRLSGTMASSSGGPVGILDVYDGGDGLHGRRCYQEGDPVPDQTGASGVNEVVAKQVIDPTVAATAKDVLSTVVTSGTGRRAQNGEPTWGKTGTTDDNGDAWFCGATPKITACVWVGYRDTVTPMETEFAGAPVDGGTFPALIFSQIATAYEEVQALHDANRGTDEDDVDESTGIEPPADTGVAPPTDSTEAPAEEAAPPVEEAPAEPPADAAATAPPPRRRPAAASPPAKRLRPPARRAAAVATGTGCSAAQNRHGSSVALVIPIRGAGRDLDPAPVRRAPAKLERWPVERRAVEVEPDPERDGELAGAGAELAQLLAPAALAHAVDPPGRLERADQHRGGGAVGLADGVEHAVDAVGEIDVGMAGRAEDRRRARRQPDVGVAGGVVALVALALDDHPADAVDAELAADQLASDLVHRAVEEVGAQGAQAQPGSARAASRVARAASSCSDRRTEEVPPAESLESSQVPSRKTS